MIREPGSRDSGSPPGRPTRRLHTAPCVIRTQWRDGIRGYLSHESEVWRCLDGPAGLGSRSTNPGMQIIAISRLSNLAQLSTAPPLCLDPDPHLTRAVNSILRVSVPTAPPSLKRKASAMDPEETAFEKVRRAKIMQFMKPTTTRPHKSVYQFILTFLYLTPFQLESIGSY